MRTFTNSNDMPRRLVFTLSASVLAFAVVAGYAMHRHNEAVRSQIRRFKMPGCWVTAPGAAAYSGYFRKQVQLSGTVRHAWVVIAARDAFELTVNGNPLGQQYLWRPTRPFQNGLNARGQRVTSPTPALALNFPREYQWTGHDHWRLPVFIDIASELQPGTNVVCVEIESRSESASVCLGGQIELRSGETISLHSDSSWQAAPVPPGVSRLEWTHPDYQAHAWRNAVTVNAPTGTTYTAAPPCVFSTPFSAQWLRHPTASHDNAVWFETSWTLATKPDRAWLRLAANRYFSLFINNQEVRVADDSRALLDGADWVIGSQRAWDVPATPELLDPDEVGSIFAGRRFESPRHGDPTADALASNENVLNRTRDKARATTRSDMPGTYDPKRTLAETRRTPDKPYAFPEKTTPKALTRDRAVGGLLAYDVTNLLQPGTNSIRVRISKSDSVAAFCWPAQFALDSEAELRSGKRSTSKGFVWSCATQALDGSLAPAIAALPTGPVAKSGVTLPQLVYRGIAKSSVGGHEWPWLIFLAICVTSLLIGVILFLVDRLADKLLPKLKHRNDRSAVLITTCHGLFSVLLSATSILFGAMLLDACLAERQETLWFTQPGSWQLVFAISLGVALLTAIVEALGQLRLKRLRDRGHVIEFTVRRLPETNVWRFAIVWLLMLCAFLRAYQLDYQPLDDDEYASTQAILAIADSGIPQFVPEEVWYTRSPLFHYLTGGVAAMFGSNLWVLRLPSALFGVATAWLAYLFGSRLLKNPWIGMGALILMTLHPFQIFTGHVIRFYQMQQFFALLTMFCFCKGFVTDQSQKWRYATIAAFLAAVLSQEISAVMGAPLAIGYLLFSRDLGWRPNLKLILVAALALVLIGLDYFAFQTRCLTRVEGISASLEAAVKPHFWQPYNFLAIYIGYSRLHVALSAFLLLGLPFVWRERNRNTIALHFMLLAGVVLTNLLVTHVSLRYQYWLIPLWILLSLDGMRALLVKLCATAHNPKLHKNRYLWNLGLASTVLFIAVVLSWSPWRIAGSYSVKLLGDSTGAFQYVGDELRDGDVLAATEPHTHAALIETGRIDYDISVPLLYDFAMLKDGRLIDRNGGAEVIGSLRQFQEVCRSHDRVWILLNREKFRSRGKNLRWEYPGARFELFVRKNCELRHRTYLWSVYLWDANRGQLTSFRDGSS